MALLETTAVFVVVDIIVVDIVVDIVVAIVVNVVVVFNVGAVVLFVLTDHIIFSGGK